MKSQQDSITGLRLAAQSLFPVQCKDAKEVVSRMGAIQAQDYNMSKCAVGIRMPNALEKDIETAFNKGEILRTHILRPTWHLVAAEDIRWMLALTAPKIKSSVQSRDRNLGLTEEIFAKTNLLIENILQKKGHLTREEIQIELASQGIETNNWQITHIMFRAELDALVCSGTLKGKKQTYALLDERVASTPVFSREESLAMLGKKYFLSHGPATIDDFVWWSGLTKTDAKKTIEMNTAYIISETIHNKTYWFNANLQAAIPQDSIHFLPAFDEYIISYKDRTDVLSPENQKRIIVSNGIFKPAIILNGEVVGGWKKNLKKGLPEIEIELFESLNNSAREQIKEASKKLCEFWK